MCFYALFLKYHVHSEILLDIVTIFKNLNNSNFPLKNEIFHSLRFQNIVCEWLEIQYLSIDLM